MPLLLLSSSTATRFCDVVDLSTALTTVSENNGHCWKDRSMSCESMDTILATEEMVRLRGPCRELKALYTSSTCYGESKDVKPQSFPPRTCAICDFTPRSCTQSSIRFTFDLFTFVAPFLTCSQSDDRYLKATCKVKLTVFYVSAFPGLYTAALIHTMIWAGRR